MGGDANAVFAYIPGTLSSGDISLAMGSLRSIKTE